MTRVINVSTICFELILEETDELDENDNDDADEREQNT